MKYYNEHEATYQKLLREGHSGWGNKSFDEMMNLPQLAEMNRVLANYPAVPSEQGAPGSRALDLGCGTGAVTFYLQKKGYRTLGVDVSSTAIEKATEFARTLALKSTFHQADFLSDSLPYKDFDLISDSSFLQHIVYDEERATALAKIKQLLSSRGVFIVHTMVSDRPFDFGPNYEFDETGILWFLRDKKNFVQGKVHPSGKWATAHARLLPAEEVRTQIRSNGFREIEAKLLYEDQAPLPASLFAVYTK